jgi:hypothetical protein
MVVELTPYKFLQAPQERHIAPLGLENFYF